MRGGYQRTLLGAGLGAVAGAAAGLALDLLERRARLSRDPVLRARRTAAAAAAHLRDSAARAALAAQHTRDAVRRGAGE